LIRREESYDDSQTETQSPSHTCEVSGAWTVPHSLSAWSL
jgi:hypothetical protein